MGWLKGAGEREVWALGNGMTPRTEDFKTRTTPTPGNVSEIFKKRNGKFDPNAVKP